MPTRKRFAAAMSTAAGATEHGDGGAPRDFVYEEARRALGTYLRREGAASKPRCRCLAQRLADDWLSRKVAAAETERSRNIKNAIRKTRGVVTAEMATWLETQVAEITSLGATQQRQAIPELEARDLARAALAKRRKSLAAQRRQEQARVRRLEQRAALQEKALTFPRKRSAGGDRRSLKALRGGGR